MWFLWGLWTRRLRLEPNNNFENDGCRFRRLDFRRVKCDDRYLDAWKISRFLRYLDVRDFDGHSDFITKILKGLVYDSWSYGFSVSRLPMICFEGIGGFQGYQ
ncbi:unnamed protein product [Rhizophagus irregularis]|nr:unnamed protein product [Rhizophagus irregularis]